MNVGEIKEAIKRYGFDDEDPLLTWINATIHQIENSFKRWSFLEEEEERTAAEGERTFELDNPVKRLVKVRDVTREGVNGGEGLDLEYYDRRKLMREFPNLMAQGKPEIFSILGRSRIQLYPVPTSSVDLLIPYIKSLEDLTDDSDVPDIPEENHYTIVRGSVSLGLQAENEEDRAANAEAQFQADLSVMIDNDQIRQVGESEYVEDVADYGGS